MDDWKYKKTAVLEKSGTAVFVFMERLEGVILAILSTACLNHYIELTLTSEPSECSVELCAAKTRLLLKLSLSHLTICVKYIPDNACVVSNVVDFHDN